MSFKSSIHPPAVSIACSLHPSYWPAETVALAFSGNNIPMAESCVLTAIRLAATLGSKSTFKKLPKRSVLTADIAQLCNLIIQPNEPLALRLSSNLMIGAARCDHCDSITSNANLENSIYKGLKN